MNKDDIIRMAREADREWDCDRDMFEWLEWFANLVASVEREQIAKMFDEPMSLVPFVQNHLGGCMICGFTPRMAATAIRARGQT